MQRFVLLCVLVLTLIASFPKILKAADNLPLTSLEYLEDSTTKLQITDLLAEGKDGRFVAAASPTLNFGFTTSAYWMRFPVENSSLRSQEYWLEIAYPILNEIEVFLVNPQNDVIFTSRTGIQRPFNTRAIKSTNFVIPMELDASSRYTVYVKVRTRGSMEIPLRLWKPSQWIANNENQNMAQGVFFGALCVMMFYNIFIYLSVRNLSYLFYVGFVFSYMGFQALMKGYAFQYIFPNYQQIISWALPLSIGLSSLFSSGFALSFLKFHEIKSRFNILLNGSALFFAVCILAIPFTSYRFIVTTLSVAATLSCLLMLAAGINRMLAGKKEARFYVLAWAVYTVGGVLFGLSKLGLIGSNFLTSNGQQIGSLIEVLFISLALADRLNTLQRENKVYANHLAQANTSLASANDQLKVYVEKIEHLVEMKTGNIRSIFATIRAGIFTIGRDLKIEKEYSPFLTEIVGKSIDDTTDPVNFLFTGTDIRQDVQAAVRSILITSLGEPLFSWEVNTPQLPREFTLARGETTHVLTCEFTPIVRDDVVERILVVVRDITEIRSLEMESKERKLELEMLAELSHIDGNKFRMLINSVQQWLGTAPALLNVNSEEEKAQAIQTMFIHVHTLKGNARSLGLLQLAEVSHLVEHYLGEVRTNLKLWDTTRLGSSLQSIKSIIDHSEFVFTNRLGRSTEATLQLQTTEVQHALASLTRSHWDVLGSVPPVRRLVDLITRHFWRDAGEFLAELMKDAERLALDLGKEPPQIIIESDSIRLPTKAQDLFFHIMTHLLRNALDHGLESGEERNAAGKSIVGSIFIRMRQAGERVQILFYDDGRGIDLNKVLTLARQKNLVNPAHQYSPDEIARFILLPGFSTRNSISTVSGRGVGLDAVCHGIRECGGQLTLRLGREEIEGYRSLVFDINLPASLFETNAYRSMALAEGF